MDLACRPEPDLSADEFVDVLGRWTLAVRRPVDESKTIRGVLRAADIIVAARAGSQLVSVCRAITDFIYCNYLAVGEAFRRRGISRELVRRTHEAAGLGTTLILLPAPKAWGYYPRIGMTGHESGWIIPAGPRRNYAGEQARPR